MYTEFESPPPEDHELDLDHNAHADDDDDGISTDTSGSLPEYPGADEENFGDAITVCRWDSCNRDLHTLDALVRHVHDCTGILCDSLRLTSSSYWHASATLYM